MGKRRSVAEALKPFGFTAQETGGGCTQYERLGAGVEMTITLTSDGMAPTKMSDAVTFGIYDVEACRPELVLQFPTVTALVRSLKSGWPMTGRD